MKRALLAAIMVSFSVPVVADINPFEAKRDVETADQGIGPGYGPDMGMMDQMYDNDIIGATLIGTINGKEIYYNTNKKVYIYKETKEAAPDDEQLKQLIDQLPEGLR
ncbi:hypothetical protein [Neptuniibacter sp. QD37_11]|uniref:hypothetical protein n=1 Tax=Neptuniibacter sp. QD37_11 TaxID=3398209 RepID=UPI0039F53534